MSFIQIVTIVSIFYVIANTIACLRYDIAQVAIKQILVVVVYISFYLASIFMGEYSDWLVIGASGLTVGILKRLANVPVRIVGTLETREREHR